MARVDSHLRNRRHPNWDGEEKRRAFTRLGFDPNPSPVMLDDFFTSGQPYPGSGTNGLVEENTTAGCDRVAGSASDLKVVHDLPSMGPRNQNLRD